MRASAVRHERTESPGEGRDTRSWRSDTSDAFTSGTLTLDPGTVLDVNGETHLDGSLFMHHGGPDASQFVQFYDGGSPAGERFGWNETRGPLHAVEHAAPRKRLAIWSRPAMPCT